MFPPKNPVEFSIGLIDTASLCNIRDQAARRVLSRSDVSDIPASFVADPFLMHYADCWYLFFEIMSRLDYRGCIGLAKSKDGECFSYQGVVLRESFHLAYPQVFVDGDNHYMVPDSIGQGVRLYRAHDFPYDWRLDSVLLDSAQLCDSTLVRHGGYWWMFSFQLGKSPRLRLFFSEDLRSGWREHQQSPLPAQTHQRPGGRIVRYEGKLVRFVQNGSGDYGQFLLAREITHLSPVEYRERSLYEQPILSGSGNGWHADGIHHIDLHSLSGAHYLACVDGLRRS